MGVFDGDLDVGSIIGANTLDASGGRIGIFANDDAPQEITGTQFGDFMFDNSVGGQAQVFHGGGGNDVIMSGDGADTLDGGTGADTMTGGLGNDTYVVDNVGDVVTENAQRRHRHGAVVDHLHARRQCREPDPDRQLPTSTAPATATPTSSPATAATTPSTAAAAPTP